MSVSKRLAMVVAMLTTVPLSAQENHQPDTNSFKKSWISVFCPESDKPVKAGEEFTVTVKYYLDASENSGAGTQLMIVPLGPWIDCPDGKYTKDRHHEGYPGLFTQVIKVEPGAGSHDFKFKATKLFRYNGIQFLAKFKDGGNDWPWHVRGGGVRFVYEDKQYQLSTGKPGGLFVYDEPVKINIDFKDGAVKGESKKLKYKLIDTLGHEVASGEQAFTVGAKDESTAFTVDVKARGTFLFEADVEGWGTRDVTFARVPDVMKITGGAKTQLAATNLYSDTECKVARMLGFTSARLFFPFSSVQPGRDEWRFDDWDKILETNKKNGIEPWLCITTPAPWILTACPAGDVGYEPFPFDEAAWRSSVEKMTLRWKDKILGWEWLNEIVPGGKSKTPSEDYRRFCEIGTEVVKKIDPSKLTLMAGGLWPRNFRTDCLNAGVGKHIDVLPVHYSDMGGVLDAIDDLKAAQYDKVIVWDDETGNGLTVWGMPSREALQVRSQSQWCLDRWPDELVAGAEKICYFGGWADPAGNWAGLLDDNTPRPVAATLAVFASKIACAKPLGKFFLGEHGVFHLFEKDGKAILVASSSTDKGEKEKIALNIGRDSAIATDYQGNETELKASGGKLTAELEPMRIFIEGGDLDVLKSYCAVSVGSSRNIERLPNLSVIKGQSAVLRVQVRGLYEKGTEGKLTVRAPDGWPTVAPVAFSVAAGKRELMEIPLAFPDSAAAGEYALKVEVEFKDTKLPKVEKPFGVSLISREMVGNLIKNGRFETPGSSEKVAADWWFGNAAKRVDSKGGLGLGSSVLRFEKADNYESASQERVLPPGHTYLYTAWVWNEDMGGGSNITHVFTDGKSQSFYTPSVFMLGTRSESWHFYSCKTEAPQNLKSIAFTPVVKGAGWAMYDNLRVTLYEGSNYTAECYRVKTPLKIDGKLDGWNKSCPIPLLCENQISLHDKSYKWTPDNLSAVAYMQWDEKFLYFAAEVKDDIHFAKTTGDETLEGDSIALAIHPANRAPGKDDKAFVYYLSSANPGGGSGACTLYRPPAHNGGLSSGQLAKDSSVYEVSVRTEGTTTIYQVKMPWSELGGINPAFGTKIGVSLLLNDNDGKGKAATMSWGEGLVPGWSPSNFGIVTFVEP